MLPDSTAFDSPTTAAAYVSQLIESRFAGALDAARPIRASGPGADADRLRDAYLDLLKLALCDLVAPATLSAARTLDGQVMSRELRGKELRVRSAGMDWPLHGLTMLGLARLDDLQGCVSAVVGDGVAGDLIEAGTWRGGASILMRATLDCLGVEGRTVWVADSFQGFPSGSSAIGTDRELTAQLAAFDFLAIPLEEVQANFARFGLDRGVQFVPGFFEQTLPSLRGRQWAIVRLDGDTYGATKAALHSLYGGLSVGGFLIVDDYAIDECRRAVDEFRTEHGITAPLEQVDWSSVRWRREAGEADPDAPPAGAQTSPAQPADGTRPRLARDRIPAVEEVDLARELARTRERFAAEFERLTGSPVAGPKAWLRRMLGRPLDPPR